MANIAEHEDRRSRRPFRRPHACRVRARVLVPSEQLGSLAQKSSRRRATRHLAAGWPDDPDTVDAAQESPEVFAQKSVGQIADHYEDVIGELTGAVRRSSGTRSVGCWRRSWPVAAPPPRRWPSIPPPSVGSCRSRSPRCEPAAPVLDNPANHHRAVPLTFDQFHYAFANAVTKTKQSSSTKPTRCPDPACRSSKRQRRTSIRGPKRR